MAELMKLLESNGAFKSDLIQDLLNPSLQTSRLSSLSDVTVTMIAPSLSSTTRPADVNLNITSSTTQSTSSHTDSNLNVYDNTTFASTGENLNGNGGIRSHPNVNNNNVTNRIVEASVGTLRSMPPNTNLNTGLTRQETDIVRGNLEAAGARSVTSDPNDNTVVDVTRILSEVQEYPSESRKLLVDQVTNAIVQAHMTTTVNTHANVAQANERIQREIEEVPEVYSHSVNSNNLWQHFVSAMLSEMTKVINFCTKLPGFPEVALEDKVHLIRQGCFEVMVTRFCVLVDHVKEEMFDPTLVMKAPRHIVQDTPMGEFLDQFFSVASQLNPLGLTDGEIGLFTAVVMLCPDREGLLNPTTVNVIQQLFLQSLYLLLKQNHTDADQTLSTLINMVPILHKINKDHLKFLRMIKMKSPTEFDNKFPALHKELFDSTN